MRVNLNKFSELQQRMITASIGALSILVALAWSDWSYFALFFGICTFALLEFYRLLGLDGNLPLTTFGTFNGLFIFVLTFLIEKYHLESRLYILVFVGLAGAYFIKLYVKKDLKPFANIAFTFLGIIYVAVPFALWNIVVFRQGVYSFEIVMGSLFILWASDTGAYFSGKKFGKRKLFQRISPKKTWEGSIGGGVAGLSVGIGLSFIFISLTPIHWIAVSLIIVVAGTYGDLVESLFKRSIQIKDSGNSLPGHGGFLDRFDGLLLATPFIAAFLELFT
ncbi:MAG: phosphatidate cytidylyltransferase [Bernardetiaceae bacterium]|nr:phosphatidate cytidylyltransferase [Bernardetiaceae bacterium]